MMSIRIVQQGVWNMARESMPLAAGYLAASVLADQRLKSRCQVSIENFPGTASALEMAIRLLSDGALHVVGFSVQGWNVRRFAAVAEAIKQTSPDTLIVFGGTHVANQAGRVFRQHPQVDVIVNGEGELTFRELILHRLGHFCLEDIAGISYRDAHGAVITTPSRPRIHDLDDIPSPILTGAIPLSHADGTFRYDAVIMETNRGCPYSCGFCYWGGAVGQKVRAFSRSRLRAELEAVAKAGAHTVVLCDANFGMLKQDRDFIEDLLEMRDRHGAPTALVTSWAKNKTATFYEIVGLMKKEGLHASFTLALQTLDGGALTSMRRRNMKINDWKELAYWLARQGLDAYAELIWGVPGETPESFLRGYDELASHVSRIAAYPLLLLPNTDFSERRADHGFITVRGERDDFEYVLANRSMTVAQNLEMIRFLFWARLLAENLVFRGLWPVLRATLGMSQSQAILSIADYLGDAETQGARLLREAAQASFADPDSLSPALAFCFGDDGFDDLMRGWWSDALQPATPPQWQVALENVIRFELQTRPLVNPALRRMADASIVEARGLAHWQVVRTYDLDVVSFIDHARHANQPLNPPAGASCAFQLLFRCGFERHVRSTNHEITVNFVAQATRLDAAAGPFVAASGTAPAVSP